MGNFMKYINCESIAKEIKEQIKSKVDELLEKPKLVVIQVGDNPASNSYIKGKIKDCNEVGIECEHVKLYESCSEEELVEIVRSMNADDSVTGVIVQLPLPKHINEKRVLKEVAVEKDVDGFRTESIFTPCTPLGIMKILDTVIDDYSGKNAVVIGRSDIVGKPVAELLLNRNCTVTICHSHTKDLGEHTRNADIIVVAVGKQGMINSLDNINDDAVIVDVGINRNEQGKLCGDVDLTNFADTHDNILVTPVPKGVGLLTRVMLLSNVLLAFTVSKLDKK